MLGFLALLVVWAVLSIAQGFDRDGRDDISAGVLLLGFGVLFLMHSLLT